MHIYRSQREAPRSLADHEGQYYTLIIQNHQMSAPDAPFALYTYYLLVIRILVDGCSGDAVGPFCRQYLHVLGKTADLTGFDNGQIVMARQ